MSPRLVAEASGESVAVRAFPDAADTGSRSHLDLWPLPRGNTAEAQARPFLQNPHQGNLWGGVSASVVCTKQEQADDGSKPGGLGMSTPGPTWLNFMYAIT